MRVGIVGLGLIGGSIGLAAAERGDEVIAFDSDPDARACGLERGAAARAEETLEAAVADADVAVVCGAGRPSAGARRADGGGHRRGLRT